MEAREQCMVKLLANRRFRSSASMVLLVPVTGRESLFSPPLGYLDQNVAERFLFHSQAALRMLRGWRTARLCPIHRQVRTWTESLGLERLNR